MKPNVLPYLLAGLLLLAAGCGGTDGPDPGRSMLAAAQEHPWQTGRSNGRELRSEHYRIFTTCSNRMLVQYLPGFMEAAHDNYLSLTGLAADPAAERMSIYLMGSRDEWETLTRAITGPYAGIYMNIEAGGFCYEGVGVFWDIGGLGTLSVASHEGLHQFFHQQMTDQLPLWLEEGMCVSAEGYAVHGDRVLFTPARNPGRAASLRRAIVEGDWLGIDELLPMDAGDAIGGHGVDRTRKAVGYYAQLWALVQMLRARPAYRDGLERLIRDAQAGRLHEALGYPRFKLDQLRRQGRAYTHVVGEPLFLHYISDDLEAFEREYRAFARELVGLET